ncbi:hypothetical protein [Pseudomonas aeruginosa]|uniref:hypothetical protein n=1 Tax=Pseudomonas aeruginosa TaxID=287 RepID=UPI003CC5EE9E
MSIDWNTAPEGATHWEPSSYEFAEGWMRKVGDKWSYWLEGSKVWGLSGPACCVSAEREATFEARPQEAWDGQGLPPVGTTCIVEPHNTLWGFSSTSGHERKILAYHTDYVWLGNGYTPLETTRIDKVDFRPIHTPDQIAAEEREKAINQMISDAGYVDPKIGTFVAMGNLYDAGYRRQESST